MWWEIKSANSQRAAATGVHWGLASEGNGESLGSLWNPPHCPRGWFPYNRAMISLQEPEQNTILGETWKWC